MGRGRGSVAKLLGHHASANATISSASRSGPGVRKRTQPAALASVPPEKGNIPMERYSKKRAKFGPSGGRIGVTSTCCQGTACTGGCKRFQLLVVGRARPNSTTACATSSASCVSLTASVETPFPRRKISTRACASPGCTGPTSSPVSERSVRSLSGSHARAARRRLAKTRPPKAPRPCCQPSGMVTKNSSSPVRAGVLSLQKSGASFIAVDLWWCLLAEVRNWCLDTILLREIVAHYLRLRSGR